MIAVFNTILTRPTRVSRYLGTPINPVSAVKGLVNIRISKRDPDVWLGGGQVYNSGVLLYTRGKEIKWKLGTNENLVPYKIEDFTPFAEFLIWEYLQQVPDGFKYEFRPEFSAIKFSDSEK